jgi:hypothetical protein
MVDQAAVGVVMAAFLVELLVLVAQATHQQLVHLKVIMVETADYQIMEII